MKTSINGEPININGEQDITANDLIRGKAGLTGTKNACNTGSCGACTILVDGKPVNSCIMNSKKLDGKEVTTVEDLKKDELNPIQKAFMDCDALQCGFCTPGFVVEATHFYNDWQKKHGKSKPSRETIAKALSGHLCRCGAYDGIYNAVQKACVGKYDHVDVIAERAEAHEKVTGKAKYTFDIELPNQLVGKIYRSNFAKAHIHELDLSEAKRVAGVFEVISLLRPSNVINYYGQEIAAVAAQNEKIAQNAIEKIKLKINLLPHVGSLEYGANKHTVYSYSMSKEDINNSSEGPPKFGKLEKNVFTPATNKFVSHFGGYARKRLKKAKEVNSKLYFESQTKTAAESHTPLEPHCAVANWTQEKLTIYMSTQSVAACAEQASREFKIPLNDVEVICEHMGGGFGAKNGYGEVERAAIMLSRATKRPVKVVNSREEELSVGGNRPETKTSTRVLISKKNKLDSLSVQSISSAGFATGGNVATLLRLIYPQGFKDLQDIDVITNLPPGKPFRAPGGPAAAFALEQLIDEIAFRRNLNPISLRLEWDKNKPRRALLDMAAKTKLWQSRAIEKQNGRYKRGIGIATGHWIYFYDPKVTVELEANSAGFIASCATQDLGTGSRSVIKKAVREHFKIPPSLVKVKIGRSNLTHGPTSAGSRATASIYPATTGACKLMEDKILKALGKNDIKKVNWEEDVKKLPKLKVTSKRGANMLLPFGAKDIAVGVGTSGSVQITEVEVDTRFGTSKVLNVWCGVSAGKIVSKKLAISQTQGGIIQGVGHALFEDRVIDEETGAVITTNLEDYKIAGIGDTPKIEVQFYEKGFKNAKERVVGIAEVVTIPTIAAIGNAVFNATGFRPTKVPITPFYLKENL